MNKTVIGVIMFILLSSIIIWVATTGSDQSSQNSGSSDTSKTSEMNNSEEKISANEVAQHNLADDCWTIIEQKVYDLTDYVDQHPGGKEILRACGTDATDLFNTRTTEDGQTIGSGTPHSSSANNRLDTFFIGDLAN